MVIGVAISIQMVTPCGMDRGVVPIALVAPSTHHHGSMYNCMSSPTTDDIEVRICGDQPLGDEDTPIQLTELYVK